MKDKKFKRQESIEWGKKVDECCDDYGTPVKKSNPSSNRKYQNVSSFSQTSEIYGFRNKKHEIIKRGHNNHAPQKRKELGSMSISHRSIASRVARLAAGKNISFRQNNAESQELADKVSEFLGKGISQNRHVFFNGLVYEHMTPVIITQSLPSAEQVSNSGANSKNVPIFFQPKKPETVRFENFVMNDKAEEIVPIHHFHDTWGYNPFGRSTSTGTSLPIKNYISKSRQGKLNNEGYYVYSLEYLEEQNNIRFQTHVGSICAIRGGMFDGAYPMPKWSADSSINDIKNEKYSSEMRIDYAKEGMHIFAIVNCYNRAYNYSEGKDVLGGSDQQERDRNVIKSLKGAAESGRVLVNYLGTTDPEKDGMIEVKEVNLEFDGNTFAGITTQSFLSIVIAWGINPKLFNMPDFNKSSLNSSGKELEIAALTLEQDLQMYRDDFCSWLSKMAIHYGVIEKGDGEFFIERPDDNLKLAILSEIASEFMSINDFRQKVLGEKMYTPEELEELITQIQRRKKSGDGNNEL